MHHQQVTVVEGLSDRLEDNRFREVKRLKKKHLPHRLHWYLSEDYFSEELLVVQSFELEQFKRITEEAFHVFEKATNHIIANNQLHTLGIPSFFHECIIHSWENKKQHPFLCGRFDINGGFKNSYGKVIEFNADTFSTLPETILWQPLQKELLKENRNVSQFNDLAEDIKRLFSQLKYETGLENPVFLGSSFGYVEDQLNTSTIIDLAYEAGFSPHYSDLEHVVFSEEEGIFYKEGDEYVKVDVWYKMIPWDWMFNEEPELAKLLSQIVLNKQAVILNPPYTAIWQNKKFLAYITKHFPNNVIAETFLEATSLHEYVAKPIYGRLGENVTIKNTKNDAISKGDFGSQELVYQKYYPLIKDLENYYYQAGMFYTTKPSALNLRAQETPIIGDDCEFMTHIVM